MSKADKTEKPTPEIPPAAPTADTLAPDELAATGEQPAAEAAPEPRKVVTVAPGVQHIEGTEIVVGGPTQQ